MTETVIKSDKYAPQIEEIRQRLAKVLETNRDSFDEPDIKRVMTDDFYVKRFLLARGKVTEAAFKMLIDALKWRKSEGFSTLRPESFPSEFYFVNPMFDYEPDREGNIALHMRVRYVLRCGPMVSHAVKWASKFFYDLELRCPAHFFTILIDFSGCGLRNAEFDFVKHAIHVLNNYTPACIKRILLIDLPPVLKLGYAIIKSWIPENGRSILKFISRAQLLEYFDQENLPDYLGGTCKRPYQGAKMVPAGCPTAIEYGLKNGVPLDQCVKIAKIYEPLVKEIGLYDLKDADLASKVEQEMKCRKDGKPVNFDPLRIISQETS